ncbi:MAG: acetyltransferase [Lachnospiraceae bacterium]|nr:acetyltransferase [Lachnospiraceae bacterium]
MNQYYECANDIMRSDKTVAVFCGGSLGKEVAGILLNETEKRIVFIDDVIDTDKIMGCVRYSYRQFKEIFNSDETYVLIATGEPFFRKKIRMMLQDDGYELGSYVSCMSYINRYARIGKGSMVFPNVYVAPYVMIDNNSIIHANAQIEAEYVGDDCFISLGVFIGADTKVGAGSFVGPQAVLRDGLTIGEECIVGMNSVVLNSVDINSVVAGNPAKVIRQNDAKRVFPQKLEDNI